MLKYDIEKFVNHPCMDFPVTVLKHFESLTKQPFEFVGITKRNRLIYHRYKLGLVIVIKIPAETRETYYDFFSTIFEDDYTVMKLDDLVIIHYSADLDTMCDECGYKNDSDYDGPLI